MKKALTVLFVLIALLGLTLFLLMKPGIPVEDLKPKYTNAASKFIEVEGLQVHYRDEGSGKPIVLIPGTGSCLQTWDGWTDELKQNRRVIRLDMPAFGLTGPRADKDYSIAMYVRFLHDFLGKIGVDTFDLGGNSLGGQIAWNYALAYPQQVRSLILVDPGGYYNQEKGGAIIFKLARIQWLADLLGGLDSKLMVKKTLEDCYYDDTKITEAKKQMYYDMSMRSGNRQAFTDRVQLIGTETPKDVRAITCPTLLLWGKQDQLIDVSMADSLAVIPKVQLIKYDNMGHVPQEEDPRQSVADALKFLQSVDMETSVQDITQSLLQAAGN